MATGLSEDKMVIKYSRHQNSILYNFSFSNFTIFLFQLQNEIGLDANQTEGKQQKIVSYNKGRSTLVLILSLDGVYKKAKKIAI